MDKLTKARKPIRAMFTKTYDAVMAETDSNKVRLHFIKLERLANELKDTDEKILEVLLDNSDEKQYTDEYEKVNEYRDKVDEARQKMECVLVLATQRASEGNHVLSDGFIGFQKTKLKLPKIELRQFSGEVRDWLGFWSQFRRIHDDPDMDKEDKFQYLIQSTVEGSRARDVVNSFPPTANNYDSAVCCLQSRFGREELLVEFYVRELLGLVIQNVSSTKRLTVLQLYDRLESHLRSLESLGMTTDKYATFLFPLVESSLPEDLLRIWLRNSIHDQVNESTENIYCDKLARLTLFLKNEVEGEQRIALAQKGFNAVNQKPERQKPKLSEVENVATASNLFSGSVKGPGNFCVFCNKSHESKECFKAQQMTLGERKNTLMKAGYCFQCLRPGHIAKICKGNVLCHFCGKKHVILMCPTLPSMISKENVETEPGEKECSSTTLSNQSCSQDVLLQTLMVKITGKRGDRVVRALIDSGSQRSYILKTLVEKLGLESSGSESMFHALFGGTESEKQVHLNYQIQLSSLDGKYTCDIPVLDQSVICGTIPRIQSGLWTKELEENGIFLSDSGEGRPEIELLLGADTYGALLTGRVQNMRCGPVAVETRLGWVVMGRLSLKNSSSMVTTSMLSVNTTITDLWKLDVLGISDPAEKISKEEREAATLEHFKKTVSVNEDGRYEVRLPWNEMSGELHDNLKIAETRCMNTTNKLQGSNKYQDYNDVFQEWLHEGVIEEIPIQDLDNKCHYLPHRGVFKENSTTPIRPVFDASCRGKESPSLNECLEKGPNLLEQIPPILVRFRRGEIGVISDIRKAFLQISIAPSDRDFLRFLWWEDITTKRYKIFRHRRVVFGLTCSPFLLGAVLELHLENSPPEMQKTAQLLKRSFYVDNCVISLDSEEEVTQFVEESTKLLSEAKFELRGWESTSTGKESRFDKISPVLGLLWDKEEDVLFCDVGPQKETGCVTRRKILASAQRIFDPIGFSCPLTLLPKLLIQGSWNSKMGWDDPLPEEVQKRFRKWEADVWRLSEVKIPRRVVVHRSEKNWSLHTFCDASQNAYAAAVFIRSYIDTESVVSVQLVMAKARVSPLKKISMPRLELLACCIGSRLAKSVRDSLGINIPEFYWTDSSVTLYWIKRDELWGVFVNNRVKEIRSLTRPEDWRHLPGDQNPADLPSRGCFVETLIDSRWWEGPPWLKLAETEWPTSEVNADEDLIKQERRKVSPSLINSSTEDGDAWYLRRFSTFSQIVRLIGWMRRFVRKSLKHTCESGDLSVSEMIEAERRLLRFAQTGVADETERQRLNSLCTFVDQDGLLRLKTKIVHREDDENFRYPILLPSNHKLVEILIRDYHLKYSHAGVQVLLGKLREDYWILRGRKTVRRVVTKCVKCRRFESKKINVDPAPLPEDRVKDTSVFEVCGVDLAGPLILKGGEKAWILLFTCAVYRAVHIDLVLSLSTEAFLQGLRRFIARRGRPRVMYSDNGTNFTGAVNSFDSLDWQKIVEETSTRRIQWKFIPPTAAWWGGWWERIIQMVKKLLRRTLGRASLTYEEALTTLCDVEAVVNSRPLTYLSEDTNDLMPLTPAMFLQDNRSIGVPDLDQLDKTNLKKRAKYLQRLREELRKRFRDEYLSLLFQSQVKGDSPRTLKIGDIVLVGSDQKKRLEWPVAKVIEMFPGRDGNVRVARVQVDGRDLIRPIQRLYPLEVTSSQDTLPVKNGGGVEPESVAPVLESEKRTKSGREVKLPTRYRI